MITIRNLLFLSGFICIHLNTYSQIGAVVSADNQKTLYAGISNPISLAVPGYTCAQTYATISNGTLSGDGCHYTAEFTDPGEATLSVFIISTTDSLPDTLIAGIETLRVLPLPDPVVKISGLRNEPITKGVLMAQKGPNAVLEGFDISTKYKITSFWVRHYSSDKKFNEIYNKGTLFNTETKEMFNASFKGDIFRFYGIKAITTDGRELELEPIELYVESKF